MKLKNIRQVLTGSWRLGVIFCLGILISNRLSGQENSPFASFRGEEVMITTTEMVPTTVILWDSKLSKKKEFLGLNREIEQILSSLVNDISDENGETYLLPAIGFSMEPLFLKNGIDSIAPRYAIQNNQLLADKYLLKGTVFVEGQTEKDMILCFTLGDNHPKIIPIDNEIKNSDLMALISALSPNSFLKLTSLHGKYPISNSCRIKNLSNVVELGCLAKKIRQLSEEQVRDLNLELRD